MPDPFDAVAAAPAKADPFDAVAAHPAVVPQGHDPFDAVASHPQGYAVQQSPPAPDLPVEDKAIAAVSDLVPDSVKQVGSEMLQYVGQSPVGTALSYLNKPMELATAGVVKGLDMAGVDGIQKELNPNGQYFPHIAYHDVINFLAPSNATVENTLKKYGFSDSISTSGRLGYAIGKAGLGLGADFVGDPINLVAAGAGKVAGSVAEAGAKVPAIAKAAEKGSEAASRIYDRTLGIFDYRTGYQDVDQAASIASALKRGDVQYLSKEFYEPLQTYNFSKEENSVLAKAIESTPNDASLADVKAAAQKHLPGQSISEGRLDQIAEAGAKIKAENAKDLVDRVESGLIPKETAESGVIENYLVHKISPEARTWAKKNPELAAEYQTQLLHEQARNVTNSGWMNDFDSGKFSRKIQKPLAEANEYMAKATKGEVPEWFISDPIIATAMKRAETMKLVRDKQLMDVMSKYALSADEVSKLGLSKEYKGILHDGFEKRTVELMRGKNSEVVPFNSLRFPNKIADKVGYMIAPREVGNFAKYVDSYNRVFRTFALAKIDYYLQNWGENFFKNYVAGVKLSDYVDATRLGSGRGFIEIGGKKVPTSDVMKLVTKYGIDSGGQFNEGLRSVLYTGKKLAQDGIVRKSTNVVGSVFNGLRHFGESGENFTRRAMFVNRLKQGMKVEDAVLDVEKYLFDFSRNTKGTDVLRRFYDPFIQAAIKTAQITPHMLLKNPKAYNFLHNNMPNAIQAAFQDPVSSAEVLAILPEYRKYQDPIVGPILTGNDWLYKIFTNQNTKLLVGGKTALLFKTPIGLDILNRFALWDSQIFKNSGTVAPLLKSAVIAFGGKDPFTGKNLDITTEPDMARRANRALLNAVESAFPLPNILGAVKQQLGIGDPQFFTPLAVRALQANFGKFVTVTNLDKEYFFRTMALAKARKEYLTELRSTIIREQTGRDSNLAFSDKPVLKNIASFVNRPYSSARVYADLNEVQRKQLLTKMAAAGLQDEMKGIEIVKNLRELDATIKTLNQNYATGSEYRLMMLKAAKQEGDQEMEKAVVPEADKGREPQSLSRQEDEEDDISDTAMEEKERAQRNQPPLPPPSSVGGLRTHKATPQERDIMRKFPGPGY